MCDHRPGLGSYMAELGHYGDRVSRDDLLRLDLRCRVAAHARPHRVWIGPRAGDRLDGGRHEINLEENKRHDAHWRDRPMRPDRRVND